MKLFSKNETNTSRQFEFDLAKVICILGMVFVHIFESMPIAATEGFDLVSYILVIILDAVFGAGTFMACMGLGLAYSTHSDPVQIIKRGIQLFFTAYILNFLRSGLAVTIYALATGDATFYDVMSYVLSTDILMFAGLALILFGVLKKLNVSDLGMALIALGMSIAANFIRLIDFKTMYLNQTIGLFIGTFNHAEDMEWDCSAFPLLTWFIFVIFGYLFGKLIRRCTNTDKFYAITLPISGVILVTYLVIAISNGLGMLSGEIQYYYQMTTPEALFVICGFLFAASVYHFAAKIIPEKAKAIMTRMSSNINRVYCIHWVLVGYASIYFVYNETEASVGFAAICGLVIYILSNILAEVYYRMKTKRKSKKTA